MKISDIVVPERFRSDMGDIAELASSIERNGLIQPIVVDGNTLVAGHRRLLAVQSLGWPSIDVVEMKDLSPTKRRSVELEENIKRKQFTWQEEITAKAELLRLRKLEFGDGSIPGPSGGYSSYDLARELRESQSNVHRDIVLAGAMEKIPSIATAKNKTRAFNRLKRISKLIGNVIDLNLPTEKPTSKIELFHGDCLDLIKDVGNESVDLVITDPPYGIDLVGVNYQDNEAYVLAILSFLFPHLYRILKNNTHCYVFCDSRKYYRISMTLQGVGFWVRPSPIILDIGFPGHYNLSDYLHAYDTIIFAVKGSRDLNMVSRDILRFPPPSEVDSIFKAQKGIEVIKEFLRLSSFEGQLVVDPFGGVFTTALACRETGRDCISFERDEEYFKLGCARLGV